MLPAPDLFVAPPPASKRIDAATYKTSTTDNKDPHAELKMKKAWETAFAPAKAIPMNAFMLWMAGSGVQIFSILIVSMMMYNPIKAIAGVQDVFSKFVITNKNADRSDSLLMPKLTFVACQLGVVALGLWKCSSMGLLPTTTSDWLAFEKQVSMSVVSYGV